MNPYQNKWWLLLGFGLSTTILNLDITIVNLALPVIAHVFHIGMTELQWINNSFMLAVTCVALLGGYFADHYGQRKIFLLGMAVFTLGSLSASIAINDGMIIIGRFLQGAGIGVAFPMVLILLSESFPIHQRGMAMGLLSTFAGVSQALGPTIGGIIVQWLGWRWAFIINLPICPAVMWIIWRKCQAGLTGLKPNQGLDVISVVLLIASLSAISIAFNEIPQWGLISVRFLAILAGGILLLITVLIRQLHLTHPWIDLTVFKIPAFAAINVIRPIFQFIFFGFYFILPLYLQNFLGYSPSESGFIILIMSVLIGVLSPIVGRFIDRIGISKPMVLAHICAIIGFSALTLTSTHLNFWVMGTGLIGMGICSGILFPAGNFTAVSALPPEKKGIGLGIYTTTGGLMNTLGIAISGALLSLVSTAYFNHQLAQAGMLNMSGQSTLQPIVSGAQPLQGLAQLYPHSSAALLPLVQNSFLIAFHTVMGLYILLNLISLFCCQFLAVRHSHPTYERLKHWTH